MVTSASKRRIVQDLKTKHHLSERRSCRLVGISRSSYHYQAHPRDDEQIRGRLCELASQYPRYGYLLLWRLLRAEGFVVNKKRVYRIYKEEFVAHHEDILVKDLTLFNEVLFEYLGRYNFRRPHQGLVYKTPAQQLASFCTNLSNMSWHRTNTCSTAP